MGKTISHHIRGAATLHANRNRPITLAGQAAPATLGKGDRCRVDIERNNKPVTTAAGQITGESLDGACWIVRCDLYKWPITVAKSRVRPVT